MMGRFLHICASWRENNGAANIARMIGQEQAGRGEVVAYGTWVSPRTIRSADEVWLHCSWLPCLWWAALWARKFVWMPEASYDPVRLTYSGWKKRLVSQVERFFLRRADFVVATCAAEADWIRAYEPRVRRVEITDIKRFFDLSHKEHKERKEGEPLHLLYLGRRHPLKGLQYLEEALRQCGNVEMWKCGNAGAANGDGGSGIVFRAESNAFGEEKGRVWDWCDVLVLPTLSENFGLVVAEALARGKRVITTDGAPAWEGDCKSKVENGKWIIGGGEMLAGYSGRLLYLKGFRDGTGETRVRLLMGAIERLAQ